MITAFDKVQCFSKLKDVPPITTWEDIQEGEIYHIPSLIFHERRDFIVLSKNERYLSIRNVKETFTSTLYKTDLIANFIAKRWKKSYDGKKINYGEN